ncbi:hypothetical protein V8E36_002061 [Tilletia maclaganii]
MSRTDSPTRRRHLRRLEDMSGTTRDVPDAATSILTRSRRRAIEISQDDDADAATRSRPSYVTTTPFPRSTSARSASTGSPDLIDSLHSSPTRRSTATGRLSPTKMANPFTSTTMTTTRKTEASPSKSPVRPAEALAARLASARSNEPRTSAFPPSNAPQASSDRAHRTEAPSSTRPTASRPSRSPSKKGVDLPSEPRAETLNRRRSFKSRTTADENENPFAPAAYSPTKDSDHKSKDDELSERAQRLIRRRSLRSVGLSDASQSEKEEAQRASPASVRINSAFTRRTRENPASEPAEATPSAVQQTQPNNDTAEAERKEKERQERMARRRSLYSYLPPKRNDTDADTKEVDALLKTEETPKTPSPKVSMFSLPQAESAVDRTRNPFVARSRPKTATQPDNGEVERNITEVKGSFARLSLEANEKGVTDLGAARPSSRPPVSTPGLHQRKDRPHSSSLAAAVATLARGGRLPLRACTILVDVRDMDGEDVSAPWIEKLKGAGARVFARWPGEKTVLTHIVWKSGRPSTLSMMRALEKEVEKKMEEGGAGAGAGAGAAAADGLVPGELVYKGTGLTRRRSMKGQAATPAAAEGRSKSIVQEDQAETLSMPLIVGVGWAQACVAEGRHVDEEPYLVEIGKQAIFQRRRRSSMAPKSAPASPETPETPRPSSAHSRGRKSLASSGLRSEIDKARRQLLQYSPMVSSPLKKRCFVDPDAYCATPVSAGLTAAPPAMKSPLTPPASSSRGAQDGYPLPTDLKWGASNGEESPDWADDGVVAMDLD